MRSELPIELPAPDWEVTTLGEICRSGGGDIQTGPFGSQLHADDYVDDGIPSIMPQDIIDGRVDVSNIARITLADAERLSRYRVRDGDIVYSRRGDIRRRALIRDDQDGWLCGTGCLRVRVGNGVLPYYISAYLGHPAVQEWIERHAVGATMLNLNTGILSSVPVALPSRDEQERIAAVLGALEDKIDSNRRLSQVLDEMAAMYFQAHFVDFVGEHNFVHVDGRQIPDGWSSARIEEIASINAASYSARAHPAAIDYVDISSVSPRSIDEIRRVAYDDAPSRARRVVRSGDTIVSTVRPERRAMAFVHQAPPTMTASTGFAVVSPTLATPTFVYRSVTHASCIDHLSQCATGSAYPAVNPSVLGAWRVPVPPDVGRGFEDFSRPLEGRRHLLAQEAKTLASVRDELLPKVISGEIRVGDATDQDEITGPALDSAVA